MMKKNLLLALILLLPLYMMGQAKKPTIMVIPADVWCTANGYMLELENQGKRTRVPDYHRAVQEDMDLVNAITKVGELMAEKEATEAALEEKMDRWVYLNDLAERIEAQKNA